MVSKVDFAISAIERCIAQAKVRSLIAAEPGEDLAQSVADLRTHFESAEEALDTFVKFRPSCAFTDAILRALVPPDLCELFTQADSERGLKTAALGRADYAQAARHRDKERDVEAEMLAHRRRQNHLHFSQHSTCLTRFRRRIAILRLALSPLPPGSRFQCDERTNGYRL